MIEASVMCGERICGDTSGLLFSLGLPDGISRSNLQAGRQADLFGAPVSPVSRSVRPEKVKGAKTSVTCGRSDSGSSESANLSAFLGSRLKQRLDTDGSIEFSLTWKQKVTPAGRLFSLLRASARRISDRGYSGWRSPDTGENRGGAYQDPEKALRLAEAGHQINLEDQSILAHWPTPDASEGGPRTPDARRGSAPGLKAASLLAPHPEVPVPPLLTGWARPSARGSQEQPIGSWQTPKAEEKVRSEEFLRGRSPNPVEVFGWTSPTAVDGRRGSLPPRPTDTGVLLSQMVAVSGWPSPLASEVRQGYQNRHNGKKGSQESLITIAIHAVYGLPISGPTSISSPAQTGKRGALAADFSLWLMGFPRAWLLVGQRVFAKRSK